MISIFSKISKNLKKPVIFGLCGAVGSLLASSLFGELFLKITNPSSLKLEKAQTILLLIDTSQSMEEGGKLSQVKTAAKHFIEQQNHPDDNFALIHFDREAQVVSQITSDKNLIKQAIDDLAPAKTSGTHLDEGLTLSLETLKNLTDSRYVVLFTDGQPVHSHSQDITLLIDTSDSMKEDGKLDEVKSAVKDFINKQNLLENRLAIVSFGNNARINADLTSDKASLIEAVETLQTNGNTRMDQGITEAVNLLMKTDTNTEDYILLFTDGKPVTEYQKPQAIVLLIDRSSSMNGGRLEEVKDAAKQFVARQTQNFPQNQLAVVDFGHDAKVATSLTSDINLLNDAIDSISIFGFTNMSEAIATATNQLQSTALMPNIILFTDGQPNNEILTFYQAQSALSQGIRLIAVGADGANMNFLGRVTGDPNLTFQASFGNLEKAFQQVDQAVSGASLQKAESQTLTAGDQAKNEQIEIIAVGTGDAEIDFLEKLAGNDRNVFQVDTGNFATAFEQADKLIAGSKEDQQAKANTVQSAEKIKSDGIQLIAVGTGEAEESFLEQLTGDPETAFYVEKVKDISSAFKEVGNIIEGKTFIEEDLSGNEGIIYSWLKENLRLEYQEKEEAEKIILIYNTVRLGIWTGILGIGMALALIIGQNIYQNNPKNPKSILSFDEFKKGLKRGLIAGLVAGGGGQLLYIFLGTSLPVLPAFISAELISWSLLGTLLGAGMSYTIVNLKTPKGIIGGFLGGSLGGWGYLGIMGFSSGIIARIISSAIIGFFIGVMIALMEKLGRQKYLLVYWNDKETTLFTIGDTPIILGSGHEAHIYLSNIQGLYPKKTAEIFQQGNAVIMKFDDEYAASKGMKKLTQPLVDGKIRKFGDIRLEVCQKTKS